MKICSRCKAPEKDGVCSLCGKNKFLKDALDNDEVYLTTAEYIWSRVVEDTLNESGIPFAKKSAVGSGITVYIGELAEEYKYYVSASEYDKAVEAISVISDFDELETDNNEIEQE